MDYDKPLCKIKDKKIIQIEEIIHLFIYFLDPVIKLRVAEAQNYQKEPDTFSPNFISHI